MVSVVLALALGVVRGGTMRRLGLVPLRWWPVVLVAVTAQLAGALIGGASYVVGLAVSAVLAVAFLLVNRRLPGVPLLALGLLLNAAVVTANGAMPVSLYAAARAGLSTGPIGDGADPRHVLADADTRLRGLDDVVPVPWPVRPEVLSPGDVLVAAGLAQLVVAGMCAGALRRRRWEVKGWGQPTDGGPDG